MRNLKNKKSFILGALSIFDIFGNTFYHTHKIHNGNSYNYRNKRIGNYFGIVGNYISDAIDISKYDTKKNSYREKTGKK